MHLPEYSKVHSSDRDRALHEQAARRILIVTNNERVRKMVVRTLATEGCAIVQASHGEEALQLIEASTEAFDLVVTDLVLPVMSGYRLGRRLAHQWPGLPVLYMSTSPAGTSVHYNL